MKLVRDKIPELYPQHSYRKATPTERLMLLRLKLAEEVGEVLSAPDGQSVLEELADLSEVADALREAYGWFEGHLAEEKTRKRAERGGFVVGWVLE
jgi:predicted house-cleaning noncanonical NTP pyrophosphatase (MazG superfamily)